MIYLYLIEIDTIFIIVKIFIFYSNFNVCINQLLSNEVRSAQSCWVIYNTNTDLNKSLWCLHRRYFSQYRLYKIIQILTFVLLPGLFVNLLLNQGIQVFVKFVITNLKKHKNKFMIAQSQARFNINYLRSKKKLLLFERSQVEENIQ